MNENLSSVWITWEKQVRNRSLSGRFNAVLYEYDFSGNQLLRYAKCIFKTLGVIYRGRKGVVFVQNPSVVLALLAVTMKFLLGYLLVVDAHNAAIFPRQKWLQRIAAFIVRRSDFTIVTNQNLADVISQRGGSPLIIPDPLPVFHNENYLRSLAVQAKKVFFICSWASDEPYFEVFKAAESLPDFTFYVTGKSKGKELGYGKALPGNVVLTGYLPDDDYHEMLATSGVILDLTTRDDCLVCGAYEATALERPFVVSDKKAIRAYFQSGCLYVDNNAKDIASGIVQMVEEYVNLKANVESSRLEMTEQWQSLFQKTQSRLLEKYQLQACN